MEASGDSAVQSLLSDGMMFNGIYCDVWIYVSNYSVETPLLHVFV